MVASIPPNPTQHAAATSAPVFRPALRETKPPTAKPSTTVAIVQFRTNLNVIILLPLRFWLENNFFHYLSPFNIMLSMFILTMLVLYTYYLNLSTLRQAQGKGLLGCFNLWEGTQKDIMLEFEEVIRV